MFGDLHSPEDVRAFQENGLGKLGVGVRGHRFCKNPILNEAPTAPMGLVDHQQGASALDHVTREIGTRTSLACESEGHVYTLHGLKENICTGSSPGTWHLALRLAASRWDLEPSPTQR